MGGGASVPGQIAGTCLQQGVADGGNQSDVDRYSDRSQQHLSRAPQFARVFGQMPGIGRAIAEEDSELSSVVFHDNVGRGPFSNVVGWFVAEIDRDFHKRTVGQCVQEPGFLLTDGRQVVGQEIIDAMTNLPAGFVFLQIVNHVVPLDLVVEKREARIACRALSIGEKVAIPQQISGATAAQEHTQGQRASDEAPPEGSPAWSVVACSFESGPVQPFEFSPCTASCTTGVPRRFMGGIASVRALANTFDVGPVPLRHR